MTWMVEVDLSYCRVVLSCHKYERVKCNIVILFYVRNCYVDHVYWDRILVIDLVYKGNISLIFIHHCIVVIL
jgi:hypothetical protein